MSLIADIVTGGHLLRSYQQVSPKPERDAILESPQGRYRRGRLQLQCADRRLGLTATRLRDLLLDANWLFTQQAAPLLPRLRTVVTVGCVKWIPNSSFTSKDDAAWLLFGAPGDAAALLRPQPRCRFGASSDASHTHGVSCYVAAQRSRHALERSRHRQLAEQSGAQ